MAIAGNGVCIAGSLGNISMAFNSSLIVIISNMTNITPEAKRNFLAWAISSSRHRYINTPIKRQAIPENCIIDELIKIAASLISGTSLSIDGPITKNTTK